MESGTPAGSESFQEFVLLHGRPEYTGSAERITPVLFALGVPTTY